MNVNSFMHKSLVLLFAVITCISLSACTSNTEINSSTIIEAPILLEPLTTEKIDQTPDSALVWLVFQHISRSIPTDSDQELAYILSLPKPQQAIYVSCVLENEVNNGGFNQFYYNPSGQFTKLVPDALKLIGATQFAALTQAANEVYEKEKEHITKHQDGTTEGFSKSYEDNPLDKFDDQFYKLKEPLGELQIAFIRKNKEAFVTRGTR
ncbi:DMP19 family protein [Pedobacter frigoris]|uniref:DMP19 family protein n=1 Tax=Pedobacter frigoris TaxID=2571272 RepID=UPI00292DC291|nr:DMP19 family protein [Pedobacter frigoris]